MKTKVKRLSKRTLAVFLGVMMLITSIGIGSLITVNSATSYYLWWSTNGSGYSSFSSTNRTTMTESNGVYKGSFSHSGTGNFYFTINTNSTTTSSGNIVTKNFADLTVTNGNSSMFNSPNCQECWNGSTAMYSVQSSFKSNTTKTIYVTYNSTTKTITFSDSDSASGGGSTTTNDWYVIGHQFDSGWNTGSKNCKMTKDTATGYYYYEKTFTANTNYYRIHNGSDQYQPANENVITLGTKYTLTNGSSRAVQISSNLTGTYRVWWDEDNKQTWVAAPETTHDVTFSVNNSSYGSISPNTSTAVGVSTPTAVTATAKEGYKFSSWTNGGGITQVTDSQSGDNQTQTITTKSSGAYTVRANFAVKNYTLTYGSASNGTFTVTKTSGGSAIANNASVDYNTGITVTTTPNKGYTATAVTCGGANATSAGTNKWTCNMPAKDAAIVVTFSPINKSITKSVMPANKATLVVSKTSNGTGTNTYNIGNTLYLRCTGVDAAYTVASYKVTFGNGSTETYNGTTASFTVTDALYGDDGALSVTAYLALKPTYPITLVTNNSAYGTITSSVAAAYSGQSVTITATENTGTLTNVVVKNDNTSANVTTNTNKSFTFTMPAAPVTATATFTKYSAQSNFYYNGYETSGGIKSSYYGKPMTEGKINGETFSYYHVTGRTEADQLFTVSYGDPAHNGYVYFCTPNGWDNKHGWDSDPDAQFYGSDGALIQTWSGMTFDSWYNQDKCWKIKIPEGARKVQFRGTANDGDTSNWPATALFDLNDLADYVDCIYISAFHKNNDGQFDSLGAKNKGNTSKPIADGFWENYNGEGKYTNNFSTGGFNGHNANRGASHAYNKPNNLDEADRGDYYIIVLYENKTYTINGETHTINKNPEIIWSTELPSETVGKVKVYAKDGSVRNENTTSGKLGDTAITNDSTNYPGVTNITNHAGTSFAADCDYQTANVAKGSTVKITTTLENEFKGTHYVKAFMVNGKGVKFFDYSSTGVYTIEYTIPEDFEGKTLEVTPVYFLKDESDTVTFKVEGFDDTVQKTGKWGTTIYAYPFYAQELEGFEQAFYAYPGQPVIEDNGKYYTQIPIHNTNPSDSSSTVVRGITLSNGYLDDVHQKCESSVVTAHKQTYDYDDFFKIYNEKKPDNITYTFKYVKDDALNGISGNNTDAKITSERNTGNKPGASFTTAQKTSLFTHGWEALTNYHGQKVNIFGNVLENQTDASATSKLYVVSDGYWYNNAGSFGTEWNVYTYNGSTYSRIATISPSALTLNSAASFSKEAYTQYDDTQYGMHMLSSFEDDYTTLLNHTTKQVEITYEHNIQGGNYKRNVKKGSTIAYQEGEDTAYRLDGRWTYSNDDDIINAKTQIRYLAANQTGIENSTEDTFADSTVDKPVGITTGATAYFTNTETNNAGNSFQYKMASGDIYGDKNKNFTFTTSVEAERTKNYVFQGWYLLKDGKYTSMSKASSPMTANDTYVALYKEVNYKTVTIGHEVMQGEGIAEVQVQVAGSSDSTLDKIYSFSENNITATIDQNSIVTITLRSTSGGIDTFNGWYDSDKTTLIDNGGAENGKIVDKLTKTITLYSDKLTFKSKTYYSSFTDQGKTFKAVFHYTDRTGVARKYTVKTKLTTDFLKDYTTNTAHNDYTLNAQVKEGVTLKQWVKDSAPRQVDLYGKDITWSMTDTQMANGFAPASYKIDINDATVAQTWNAKIVKHTDGVSGSANTSSTTYSNIDNNHYITYNTEGTYDASGSNYVTENHKNFKYWSVSALNADGETSSGVELMRVHNPQFLGKVVGNIFVEAVYSDEVGDVTAIQEPVYSHEVYDLDADEDTKIEMLYSDFIVSYMRETNDLFLNNNSNYISGIAVEVSQGAKISSNKTVDYADYIFESNENTVKGFIADQVNSSTTFGKKLGGYTQGTDKRSVYSYKITDSNYNNFNRTDLALSYLSSSVWNDYVMKAYYYVKNVTNGEVSISQPVYFCLHNTKVTVTAETNTISD